MSKKRQGPFDKLAKVLKNREALSTIKKAGAQHQKVEIIYKKDDGTVVRRLVSPYEIKSHRKSGRKMLYVTDNKHGADQILSLAASQVRSAKVSSKHYDPNWPVQVTLRQKVGNFLSNLRNKL